MSKIELKDYSCSEYENKRLYKAVKESSIILDSSICEVVGGDKETKPILEIRRSDKENYVTITTFGFVGRFTYQKVMFDIGYRFGEKVLDRMITLVNDFDVKTLELKASNSKNTHDSLAMKILFMNFIFKLEKLSILGLPKSYQKIEHHNHHVKGQIDIGRFIKKDIPFTGKISSTSHEQVYVQEIVDLLFAATQVVEKSMPSLVQSRVFQVRNLLYTHANRRFVDMATIEKALHHKAVQNALYSEFKSLLESASYIVKTENGLTHKSDNQINGLIFDVSILWERYLYKLLKNHFEDKGWKVFHEERIPAYEGKFYERNMYPDIVMKKENQVVIFDAKSKSMEFKSRNNSGLGDLDREDFFQINTYMAYYQNSGETVVAGGLLYPLSGKIDECKCHSEDWLGNKETKFIVDGIEILKCKSIKSIKCREERLLNRVQGSVQKSVSASDNT